MMRHYSHQKLVSDNKCPEYCSSYLPTTLAGTHLVAFGKGDMGIVNTPTLKKNQLAPYLNTYFFATHISQLHDFVHSTFIPEQFPTK